MLDGVMPLAWTLDTVGVHAQTFEDVVSVTEVICDSDFSHGRAGELIALDWGDNVACEDDVKNSFNNLISQIGPLSTTDLAPYAYGQSRRAGLIISEVEGYAFHAPMLEKDPMGFSDFFRGMLEYGRDLPLAKIEEAYDHVKNMRNAKLPDFILMPTTPQTAFKFGDLIPANQADFTAFANLADRPAISFPIGTDRDGLPISAQLVGPRGQEANLVATVKSLLSGSLGKIINS